MHTNHKFHLDHIQQALDNYSDGTTSSKYELLYLSIKNCIVNSLLPNDSLLPTTRLLANELDCSRSTVNKAYDLLKLERLITSKQGSGHYISYIAEKNMKSLSSKLDQGTYPALSERGLIYAENVSLLNRMPNENMAFRPGLPPLDAFPINQWKRLLNNYWKHVKSSSLNYALSTGMSDLKHSISNYLNISRNIQCDPDQIVIVSGSLQSLYLVSNALINEGDAVVLEDPVFPNVHSVFKSAQASILSARIDGDGIDLNSIKNMPESVKLIHVTPSNHYPLGIKMSLERRKEVLAFAKARKALIIENDYESEIANNNGQTPSIFSLDNEDRTIYMGTFNRLLHPSIRLGYMVVPPYLSLVIQALLEHSHRFVSPSIQVVMNEFIKKNYLYQHLHNIIEVARERHALFISEFNKSSRKMHIRDKTFSSFHLIAYFKEDISASEEMDIIKQLNANNITAFSLSKCYLNNPKEKGLILGYASVRNSVLIRKVKIMSEFI
jgi:GntR family transcriptional regulator/MocR family aminotransferase